MKHTLMFLKVIVFIILALIMIAGWCCGALFAFVGLLCAIADNSALPMIGVPIGLVFGFIGYVAQDAIEYIDNKWSWK